MRDAPNITQIVDHLFRHESGKMVSVLSRLLGPQNLDAAEDIVQDTLLQAMTTWSFNMVPENPSGWLLRVAKNKAIDYLRRQKKLKEIGPKYEHLAHSEYAIASAVFNLFLESEIQDSQLRMMFLCCHPAVAEESQIALTLKTLCGLSVDEIAKAFLTNEETINKRIQRAKEKIRSENIELRVPQGNELPGRLETVLKSLYLLFNEGYNSSHPDTLIREDLCQEALRLTFLLTTNKITNTSNTNALLSLMCFQASRLQARIDDKGNIILMKYQDRIKWHKPLVELGAYYLEIAADTNDISTYHLEATIASMHAVAPSFEKTNWPAITKLYESLYQIQPAPIVALNKAIACAYAGQKDAALEQLMAIKGLENYYLYHTSVGEVYFELKNHDLARQYYEKALQLTPSKHEQQLLRDKIAACNPIL